MKKMVLIIKPKIKKEIPILRNDEEERAKKMVIPKVVKKKVKNV